MDNTTSRFEKGYHMLVQWLTIKQNGGTLRPYFEDNQIQTIAIYGLGILGELFYKDLKETDIEIRYAIDRLPDSRNIKELNLYLPHQPLPNADLIVITPVHLFWEITQEMSLRTSIPMVSLEDIVDYCM